jgi:hypothetical protein
MLHVTSMRKSFYRGKHALGLASHVTISPLFFDFQD